VGATRFRDQRTQTNWVALNDIGPIQGFRCPERTHKGREGSERGERPVQVRTDSAGHEGWGAGMCRDEPQALSRVKTASCVEERRKTWRKKPCGGGDFCSEREKTRSQRTGVGMGWGQSTDVEERNRASRRRRQWRQVGDCEAGRKWRQSCWQKEEAGAVRGQP
jgi:hypothetical protein